MCSVLLFCSCPFLHSNSTVNAVILCPLASKYPSSERVFLSGTILGVFFALFFHSSPVSRHYLTTYSTALQPAVSPGDLPHRRPLPLIAFDPVCHAGCNCHSLKAFKAIKSSSALGVRQYISALIRTLSSKS